MSQTVDYKCPRCGGSVTYDASAGAMRCGNCGSVFDPSQFQVEAPPPARSEGAPEAPPDLREHTCTSCGATVVTEGVAAAGSCPYCRSPIVMVEQVTGQVAPDLVVPFGCTRDQAVEALRRLYEGKRLLPKVFASQNFVDEVKGVYVPFWLFDYETDVTEEFEGVTTSTVSVGSKRHVTTSTYRSTRQGQATFRAVPVDGSANMPDAIMESIQPYDLRQGEPFQPAYLSGFLAERYDVDLEHAAPRAYQRVQQTAGQIFRHTVSGYGTVSVRSAQIGVRTAQAYYALLPVWMLTTIWRGQRFTFAMNGQTGRMVGDLPLDRGAYWRWFGLLATGSAVLAGGLASLGALIL